MSMVGVLLFQITACEAKEPGNAVTPAICPLLLILKAEPKFEPGMPRLEMLLFSHMTGSNAVAWSLILLLPAMTDALFIEKGSVGPPKDSKKVKE